MIELEAIAKKYGENFVLKSIDTVIPTGYVYGLVGKNGAGKTTLLNIISGISDSSAGQCIIDGEIIKKGTPVHGVSYLPDLPSFFDCLTIEEYIKFILSNKDNSSVDYEDYIERFMLNKKAIIKTLSRGNRQKVGLLIATIIAPKVLLLDEPTSALDPVGRKEVISIIRELKDSGTTIIFSTHILSDMELVCDKVGFLHNGIIAKEVDLKNSKTDDTFELSFCGKITHEKIASYFPEHPLNYRDDVVVIHNIDQCSLFNTLTKNGLKIISLKKTPKINLEQTMTEVLKK